LHFDAVSAVCSKLAQQAPRSIGANIWPNAAIETEFKSAFLNARYWEDAVEKLQNSLATKLSEFFSKQMRNQKLNPQLLRGVWVSFHLLTTIPSY
jgi:hypothetical protein